MSRIEWTRYSGDDIEDVVAIMIHRDRGSTIQITPSRGDGGVDIFDPPRAGKGGSVIQVKSFAGPLTPSQKRQVRRSLKALSLDPRWKSWNVESWELCTPWSPTPEAIDWLRQTAQPYGFAWTWKGLDYIEGLVAKFPEVVDYYFHGRRRHVDSAVQGLVSLLRLQEQARNASSEADQPIDEGGPLAVSELGPAFASMLDTANRDPLYRFDLSIGESNGSDAEAVILTSLQQRPGYVMSCSAENLESKRWYRVDVYARCAASTSLRPLKGRFTAKLLPGSSAEDSVRAFDLYGGDLHLDGIETTVEMDLPGGLGGTHSGARIKLTSSPTPEIEIRAVILDRSGQVLAEVGLVRTEATSGISGKGARAVFRETKDTFAFEVRWSQERSHIVESEYTVKNWTGYPVKKLVDGANYLTHLHPPNQLGFVPRYGPAKPKSQDLSNVPAGLEPLADYYAQVLEIVEALVVIQDSVAQTILFPDLDGLSDEEVAEWIGVATLLQGGELRRRRPGFDTLVEMPAHTIIGRHDNYAIVHRIETSVGDQRLMVGEFHEHLVDVDVVERVELRGTDLALFRIAIPEQDTRLAQPNMGNMI